MSLREVATEGPTVLQGQSDLMGQLVSSGASLTSWGEGTYLALVGHPSSDGDRPPLHPIFSYWVGEN